MPLILIICALLVAAMVGCGSDPTPSDPQATSTTSWNAGALKVAGLGDSITAGTPLWDPNPTVREQIITPSKESQYGYWLERKRPDVSFRNCGVNGERVDEIAERYQQCTDGADVVIVQGGINDIAQGGEADTIAAGIRELVQRAQEEDKQVLMVEILPWNNGGESAAKIIQETNGLLKTVAAEQSVPLLAWYELLRTPGGARRMRADLTIEGDHPSVAGYQKLGEYTASVLE